MPFQRGNNNTSTWIIHHVALLLWTVFFMTANNEIAGFVAVVVVETPSNTTPSWKRSTQKRAWMTNNKYHSNNENDNDDDDDDEKENAAMMITSSIATTPIMMNSSNSRRLFLKDVVLLASATTASSLAMPSSEASALEPTVSSSSSSSEIQTTTTILESTAAGGGGGSESTEPFHSTVESTGSGSSAGSTDFRFFVAGGTCAAISHGVTTPIDVVKTKIQAQPDVYSSNLIEAASQIYKKERLSSLLQGLGPTVIGYGLEGALKFGLYEILKLQFLLHLSTTSSSSDASNNILPYYLLASVIAGAVASVVLCPMESTRIRIVTDPKFANDGLMDGLPRLIRQEGLLSTFSGIYAMLSKQVPYTMAKQVSFDYFAALLYAYYYSYSSSSSHLHIDADFLKVAVPILAAFLSSILACIASHPGDVLLTETYKKGSGTVSTSTSTTTPGDFFRLASTLYDQKGVGGFFTGIVPRFVHVGTIITSQLVIYDFIKQLLGLPATGTH